MPDISHSVIRNTILYICLFLSSCDTVSYISLNVKEPADIVLPSHIKDIVIVNVANSEIKKDTHKFIYGNKEEVIELEADTLSEIFCRSLWTILDEENFFNRVDFFNIPHHVDKNAVNINEIMEQTQVDAAILLKDLNVLSILSITDVSSYGILRAGYNVYTEPVVEITDLKGFNNSISLNDTIFWEAYGMEPNATLSDLPYLNEALITATEQAAVMLMNKMIPHWTTEYRRYYSSTKGEMKKAAEFLNDNDWGNAFLLWQTMYERTNKTSQKAKCAANIALYYEIQNNIDSALLWAKQSKQEFTTAGSGKDKESAEYMNDYIQRLSYRVKENALLDMQEYNNN